MKQGNGRSSLLLLALAYVGFISLGLPDAITGVAWPSVRETFRLPQAGLGFVVACAGAGYVVSSLMAARVISAFGVGGLLLGSTVLVAVAQLGFATSPLWLLFLTSAFVAGLGSGSIDTGLNAYATRHFSLRHMNWLHACYSVGAAVGPLIMTAVIARQHPWRWGYGAVALIMAALSVTFALTHRMWNDAPPLSGESAAPPPSVELETLTQALRHPVVVLQALLFFLLTGLEILVGQWCFTAFTEWRQVPAGVAGIWAASYWCAHAGGRFALGAVAERIGAARLIRGGVLTALCGCVLFSVASTPLAALGLLLIGLGLAPMYPTLMSGTLERLGHGRLARAVGIQVSAAMIGSIALPALTGVAAGHFGLWTVGAAAVACATALTLLHEVLLRRPAET